MYAVYKTNAVECCRTLSNAVKLCQRLAKFVEHSEEGADFDIKLHNSTHLISFKKHRRWRKKLSKKIGDACRKKLSCRNGGSIFK